MRRALAGATMIVVTRLLLILLAVLVAFAPASPARADPGDVEAAARGVVRVVLIAREPAGEDGEEGGVIPLSHGSGFAVAPNLIVTNAHVIREALQDDTLRIGIVPSESVEADSDGAFATPVAVSPRNDLALLRIRDDSLRLPPLSIAGGVSGDMGEVSAVGYPMNVDLAQGLTMDDIFDAQPPVKSRGFLSGERPSRQFDSLLHTAPIARGNSGGPLLDSCGRVLGVNSFGADSDGSDAEFYFAVSLRELLPFLRANDVEPRTNSLPCRSIDELNAAERARFEQQRAEAAAQLDAREDRLREEREAARLQALIEISEEREDAMALALVLTLLGAGGLAAAVRLRQRRSQMFAGVMEAEPGEALHEGSRFASGPMDAQTRAMIAAGLGGACLIGALLVWITRPGFSEMEDRIAAIMGADESTGEANPAGAGPPSPARDGTMICSFVPERSRVTVARTDDIEFEWAADGCVNGRTQYGRSDGEWERVFVPNDEAAVTINRYDPQTRIFRRDRYLLGVSAMERLREARASYDPPACGVTDAARLVDQQQDAIVSALPNRPNERLIFTCEPKASGDDAAPLAADAED